jgi:hypothetical protein
MSYFGLAQIKTRNLSPGGGGMTTRACAKLPFCRKPGGEPFCTVIRERISESMNDPNSEVYPATRGYILMKAERGAVATSRKQCCRHCPSELTNSTYGVHMSAFNSCDQAGVRSESDLTYGLYRDSRVPSMRISMSGRKASRFHRVPARRRSLCGFEHRDADFSGVPHGDFLYLAGNTPSCFSAGSLAVSHSAQ